MGGVWTGFSDLYVAAGATVALIFIRYAVEYFIAKPIAIWGGISPNTRTPPSKNPTLEAAYKKSRKVPKDKMVRPHARLRFGLMHADTQTQVDTLTDT